MITIDEKTVGIWNLQTTESQDWLCSIRELVADEKYELMYRFRYGKDDKIFDSEDKKNWYRGEVSGTRNYVLGSIRAVAQTLAGVAVGSLCEVMNNGDVKEFLEKIAEMPGMYVRRESLKK